jgi:hypothetical protein
VVPLEIDDPGFECGSPNFETDLERKFLESREPGPSLLFMLQSISSVESRRCFLLLTGCSFVFFAFGLDA